MKSFVLEETKKNLNHGETLVSLNHSFPYVFGLPCKNNDFFGVYITDIKTMLTCSEPKPNRVFEFQSEDNFITVELMDVRSVIRSIWEGDLRSFCQYISLANEDAIYVNRSFSSCVNLKHFSSTDCFGDLKTKLKVLKKQKDLPNSELALLYLYALVLQDLLVGTTPSLDKKSEISSIFGEICSLETDEEKHKRILMIIKEKVKEIVEYTNKQGNNLGQPKSEEYFKETLFECLVNLLSSRINKDNHSDQKVVEMNEMIIKNLGLTQLIQSKLK